MKKSKKVSVRYFSGLTARVVVVITICILFTLTGSGQRETTNKLKNTSIENGFTIPAGKSPDSIRIALAQIRRGHKIPEGVRKIDSILFECSRRGVDIVCFPETYLPGLRGGGNDSLLPSPDQEAMEKALKEIQVSCNKNRVAAIVGMEWLSSAGLENRAFVISGEGKVLGHQTKNQITPGGEERNYVPENKRRLFSIKGVPFGIVICHEGWRYPETVRWAAVRRAKIVFQPQVTGSDDPGKFVPKPWGQSYYEMAMVLRSKENSIYFASVNECMNKQNSATSLIDPEGNMIAHLQCGVEGLIIKDIYLASATGFYAGRYHPERYEEDK